MKYTGEYTREISFPIGGIGTGCFGIAGNGSFIDWEIFNRPAKGKRLDYSHIAVRAKTADKTTVKILCGDYVRDLTGTYQQKSFRGFGFGPDTGSMCGLPHFEKLEFDGSFPIATLTFTDKDFPGKVVLTAFNPFIPLDSENSSIPAGFFKIDFENPTDSEIEYSAVFTMANPFEQSVNTDASVAGAKILKLYSDIEKTDIKYGDISVMTDCADAAVQQYWYRGSWFDSLDVFVHQLSGLDRLPDRCYNEKREKGSDVGSVAAYKTVGAHGEGSIKFTLTWNIPNNYKYWQTDEEPAPWKNYYATVWASSVESGRYCLAGFDSLLERTAAFRQALDSSTLDPAVIDAAASNLSVLKSPTVLRLEDGSFWAWEGVNEQVGSCSGTCQHVWNYAYAMCFLFPDLERGIRDNELEYSTDEDGRTIFRMPIPLNGWRSPHRACLDGQMGTVIKLYREWKLCGDTEWLRSKWDKIKLILGYAWSEANPDRWDRDHDGVLEGRQHHTLDMELFGPSGWLQGMYLTALKAAGEMARFLGDTDAEKEYTELYESGYRYTKENLFNGEYFIQKIDLSDRSVSDAFDCSEGDKGYWYGEAGQLKYQIGDGCEIDQLLGQWHASLCGLGEVFDAGQKKKALESLYKYNFKPCMRDALNTWRVFSLGDEGGAVMCSFPKMKPIIPLSYYSETMTGFEYSLAGLMIAEGMEDEGLTIIRAIRDRYDGKKRNPWNEIECGSNYARSMASFALLPIYSGFKFNLPSRALGFAPIKTGDFKCFFSVGSAWGMLIKKDGEMAIELKEGFIELERFEGAGSAKALFIDGTETKFEVTENTVRFAPTRIEGSLVIKL